MVRYGNARAAVASNLDAGGLAVVDELLEGLYASRGSGPQKSTLDQADLEDEIRSKAEALEATRRERVLAEQEALGDADEASELRDALRLGRLLLAGQEVTL